MLRKAMYTYFRQVHRPVFPFRCTHHKLSFSAISHGNSEEISVLADPVESRPRRTQKYNLQPLLTLQQNETLTHLQEMKELQEVLNFLRNNDKIIVPFYAAIFDQIWHILKSNSPGMSKEQFVRSPEFEKFCVRVKKSVRAIRPSDIITILKTLKYLGVSMNSTLCQHLLQILTKSVNDLDLKQIMFISFLLHKAPPSPIVEALKLSTPIVFDANVRNKLNTANINALLTSLNFAAFNNTSQESIDIIVNAIWEHGETLTCTQAKDIVLRLCKIKKLNSDRKKLFKLCMEKINEEMMEQLTFNDIHDLASYTISCFLSNHVFYYNETFLSNVSTYILHHKLDLSDCSRMLKLYNRICYFNIELLDYIDHILGKLDWRELVDQDIVMPFISSCSNTRYKPPNWVLYEDNMINMFLSNASFEPYLLRTTLELTTLQCWHRSLIEKVFSPDFLNNLLKEEKPVDYLSVLSLYQQVLTLYPGKYEGILPPSDVIENAIKIMSCIDRDDLLRPALENLFGGENFVISDLKTKLGHSIDNLIVLRKDGTPFPLREQGAKDGQYLEDVITPPNGYSLAIMIQKPTSYCIDGIRLRGRSKAYIDSVNALGVIAIPFSLNVWESLPDYEKLPYLKREIFSRIPVSDNSFEIMQ